MDGKRDIASSMLFEAMESTRWSDLGTLSSERTPHEAAFNVHARGEPQPDGSVLHVLDLSHRR